MKIIMGFTIYKKDRTEDRLDATRVEAGDNIISFYDGDKIIASYSYDEVRYFKSRLYDLKRVEYLEEELERCRKIMREAGLVN